MKIYFAGPLFSKAEKDFNKSLANKLISYGHEVFLPQDSEQQQSSCRQIFVSDITGIDWSDIIIANMDGSDPDSGTCFECGYAYGKKPIIVFRTDFRKISEQQELNRDLDKKNIVNLMLTQSANHVLHLPDLSIDEIAIKLNEILGSY
jgi:nucleoside 2-deoxyribosyltransferase